MVSRYRNGEGTEYYISVEYPRNTVGSADPYDSYTLGHIRLRIPDNLDKPQPWRLNEFRMGVHTGIIRELHVYGSLKNRSSGDKDGCSYIGGQHRGLGTRLMRCAESIAAREGLKRLAVISGIGVRDYYRNLGYSILHNHGYYMMKDLTNIRIMRGLDKLMSLSVSQSNGSQTYVIPYRDTIDLVDFRTQVIMLLAVLVIILTYCAFS